MPVPTTLEQIDIQLTPQNADDRVSAEEVRYITKMIVGDVREMGTLQLTTIGELITKTSEDGIFAYVKDVGFFRYAVEGNVDNDTVQPSPDGGVWVKQAIGASSGPDGVDLSNYVPKTTTINGIPLDDDIILDKNALDLFNVENIPPEDMPLSTAQKEYVDALRTLVETQATTIATQASAIAALQGAMVNKANLVNGKVTSNELPSYVSEILEYATVGAFPVVGATDKLYLPLDDVTKLYRWSGSVYVNIGGAGGGSVQDKYFLTTDGQTTVTLTETIGKYLLSVRIGLDANWQVLHGGSGALAADQVRHNPSNGQLTFGSALPDSANNVALYQ